MEQYSSSLPRWLRKKTVTRGLYLWGSVGVGKTWMMDLFYESLPFKNKWRSHFHEFMEEVHDQLQRYQGKADPLKKIARDFAQSYRIICFDEFVVNDIGDAMILGNLLAALFKEGITLITTSNVAPENLYKNGLQRARFIPAIQLLKKHLDILPIKTSQDYRRRDLRSAQIFFAPATSETPAQLEKLFAQSASGDIRYHKDLWLYERCIKTVAFADQILWVEFPELCRIPRSQSDYLALARRYPTLILSKLRTIRSDETNLARYLINLIDILYDQKIKLILSSSVALDDLYAAGELSFEFKRTLSRLQEMQSEAYLASTRAYEKRT